MAIANYSKTCSKNVAGALTVWLTEATNITAGTVVNDEITVLTLGTAKTFKTIDVDQDSITAMSEGTGTGSNISYVNSIEIKLSKLSAAQRTLINSLMDASPCGIVALVKDGNGLYQCYGWNETDLTTRGLKLVSDSFTTGTAPDDAEGNKSTIRLECKTGYRVLTVKSTSTVAVGGITAAS